MVEGEFGFVIAKKLRAFDDRHRTTVQNRPTRVLTDSDHRVGLVLKSFDLRSLGEEPASAKAAYFNRAICLQSPNPSARASSGDVHGVCTAEALTDLIAR